MFTPGTGKHHASAYFAHAIQAITHLNRRAIFLSRHCERQPQVLPQTVLWQSEAPLHALLPHTLALVHHGGIGTMAEAFRAGISQLVVPLAHDQFDNAARIEELGVGRSLTSRKLNARTLQRALQTLFSSSVLRDRCATTVLRFSTPKNSAALYRAIESA